MVAINITGAEARAFMDRVAQFYGGRLDSLLVTITEDDASLGRIPIPAVHTGQLIVKVNNVHQAVANGTIGQPADPIDRLETIMADYRQGRSTTNTLSEVMDLLPQAYEKLVSRAAM